MNKATLSKILSIVLTAVLALAAVFGYNVAIAQPQLAALQAQIAAAPPQFGTRGITHYSELSAANITATDDLTVGDAASITGALSAASVQSSGPITGTTGNFSGANDHARINLRSDSGDGGGVIEAWDPWSKKGQISMHTMGNYTAAIYGIQDVALVPTEGQFLESEAALVATRELGANRVEILGAFRPQKLTAIAKTADYTLNTDNLGAWISNLGAGAAITLTLPVAQEGYNMCFYVATAQTMTIDPAGTNQILALTNAGGDRIANGTAGNAVCLLGLSASQWGATSLSGTWADAN